MLIDVKNDFHEDKNFWEQYPDLCIAGAAGKLYKADKSRNKANSSKILWCIALCYDRSSKYFNFPELGDDGKVSMLFGDYFGDSKWPWKNTKKFEELKEFYMSSQISRLERTLIDAEEKMDERRIFLKATKYTMGSLCEKTGKYIGTTADLLDKMQSNTDKIYMNIEKAMKLVAAEQAATKDGIQKGGGEASLSDQEMI